MYDVIVFAVGGNGHLSWYVAGNMGFGPAEFQVSCQ